MFARNPSKHIQHSTTEQEYKALLEVMDYITDQIDTRGETVKDSIFTPLFDLVAAYMLEWERALEPTTVAQTLQFLMNQHGLTQFALANEMGVTQSYISKILFGEQEIGKALVKRLGQRFNLFSAIFL
jgi:antitoxin component HigA of HigAB toxin-antitoxin module